MEPGLGGREDLPAVKVPPAMVTVPQWSPASGAGKTIGLGGRVGLDGAAAMEPGLGGREDATPRPPGMRRTPCRNGARPRGPGRLDGHVQRRGQLGEPQWSPASGAGKTVLDTPLLDRLREPQWSPASGAGKTARLRHRRRRRPGRRNGARPRGPGRPRTAASRFDGTDTPQWSPASGAGKTWSSTSSSSPYIRPQWSPASGAGKTGGREDVVHPVAVAAMEPGLGGREDSGAAGAASHAISPQWSPASGAGKTRRPHVRAGHRGVAAMEPGLGGREDDIRKLGERMFQHCRNGARPRGPGRPAPRVRSRTPR